MAQPISCEQYNLVKDVKSQQSALQETAFASIWLDIVNILAKHDALAHFGIGLLHRHRDLPSDHAMVHEINDDGDLECRPEALGTRILYPASYYLRDDGTFAYEFSPKPTPAPTDAFLAEMTKVLGAYHLQDLVSLSHIPAWGNTWLEQMTEDMEGTLSVKCDEGLVLPQDEYIVTEWGFSKTKDGPEMVALKACAKQENGGHLRTSDDSLEGMCKAS